MITCSCSVKLFALARYALAWFGKETHCWRWKWKSPGRSLQPHFVIRKSIDIMFEFIYSLRIKIIPIPLDKFVKTFDLRIPGIEGKQFFPYKFNEPENYYKKLDSLPAKEFYTPNSMAPRKREEFLKWYDANQHTQFCLKEALADYCQSDVKILVNGLLKMRQLFMDVTKTDITESITLPSALIKYVSINIINIFNFKLFRWNFSRAQIMGRANTSSRICERKLIYLF